MRFEIVINREPDAEEGEKPWSAAMFPIDEDGESGDSIAWGHGDEAREALHELVTSADWDEIEKEEP